MFEEFNDLLAAGDLGDIVTSTVGQIIVWVVVAVFLFGIFLVTRSKEKNSTTALTYSGLAIALGTVLSMIKLFEMPQGGSSTAFSMLAITSIGYFYGLRQGVLCGVAYGFLQLIIDPQVYYIPQLFLDYPIAFAMLGLSGLFAKKKSYIALPIGYAISVIARYFIHVLSGVVFFSEYAEGNPIWYSVTYNFPYIGVEGLITLGVLLLPPVVKLFSYLKTNALKTSLSV